MNRLLEKMMVEKVILFRIFTVVSGLCALVSLVVALFVPAWIVFDMRISPGGRMGNAAIPKPPPAPGVTDKFGLTHADRKTLMGVQDGMAPSSLDHHRNKMKLKLLGLNIKTSANIGLWMVSACVDAGTHMGEQCMSMSMDRFAQSLTQSNTAVGTQGFQVFFGHFEALQILMIMSLVCACGGFLLLFIYHRREKAYDPLKTNIGVLCAICWAVAAILVFAAIAAEGHQNTNMSNSIDMMKAVNPNNEHFDMNVYFPWALLLCGFGGFFCLLVQLSLAVWMCKRPDHVGSSSDWHEFSNQTQTS